MEKELRKALVLYRQHDGQTPSLSLTLPVDPLCDTESCHLLSERLRATQALWERQIASKAIANVLPNHPGLYMFVWRPMLSFYLASAKYPHDGAAAGTGATAVERPFYVLYVGKAGDNSSGTIRSRFKAEYGKLIGADASLIWKGGAATRGEKLAKWLNLWPLEFWYLQLSSDADISGLESLLIRALSPPCNNQLKARVKQSQPAF